jgi:arsenate reductase
MPLRALIYHNPRCSKSRAALQLLIDRGIAVEVIDYQATPPSLADLRGLVAILGQSARSLVRFQEDIAVELNLSADDDRSEDEWLSLLSTHPSLIERPIVVIGGRAVVGRPPENVLTLL